MARQVQPAEVTSFVRGLITEASPLTFPDNASLDEDNFVLNTDGTRQRRLGMDYEEDYVEISTGSPADPSDMAFTSFTWENAGGDSDKTIVVTQHGNVLSFFDTDSQPLSSGHIIDYGLNSTTTTPVPFSYAVVDGVLIVATGEKVIRQFEYTGSTVTQDAYRLKMRDLFGVEETNDTDGESLSGSGVAIRPNGLTNQHRYNLRNQTFAAPRRCKSGTLSESEYDPIRGFFHESGKFPSNADAVTYHLGAWLEDSETEESYLPKEALNNPPGNYRAPSGYFIIDVLDRGSSRQTAVNELYNTYPTLDYEISTLPSDSTPSGATCVAEYAGRIWYAGFSGEVVGGDALSPRLSSYVFYSQLVTDPSKLPLCYQEGDPTSSETPDLVDTDGGFIRIDSAYGIKKLVNIGSGILVVAENGVWMISGGSDYGFTATNNMRRKVTDRGAISSGSVIQLDTGIMYWAKDSIYQIGPNQFGDYEATNMTQQTIQSFYDDISSVHKKYAQGIWDSYSQKARWVYSNRLSDTASTKELIFDATLQAFYTSTIGSSGSILPRVVSPVEVPPFRVLATSEDVTHNGVTVTQDSETVTATIDVLGDSGFTEAAYAVVTSLSPFRFTFATYRDTSFKDWVSEDGVGIDAKAYMLTGYLSGGDFLRKKDVPYIQFYLRRTETGFEEDETGNLFPVGESSCLVSSQWSWTDSANSNKWGKQFQAYRYRRLYMPTGASDEFDNGHSVITTRSKLRGSGHVVSILIETEEGKDLQLLGWSMLMGIGNGY